MARNTSKTLFCNPLLGDREKPGAKEGGGTDLALLCPPRTAVPLDTSMGTEAEAIQSSPRFFLVSTTGFGRALLRRLSVGPARNKPGTDRTLSRCCRSIGS